MSAMAAAGPISGITKVFGMLGKGVSAAMGPLGMFIDILSALGIVQPLLDLFNAFISILGTAFVPAMTAVMDCITPLIPPFQELVTAITPLITLIISMLVPTDLVKELLPTITTSLTTLASTITTITPYLTAISDVIIGFQVANMLAGLNALWELLQTMGDFWGDIFTNLFELDFEGMWNDIVSDLSYGFQVVADFFSGIWTRITDALASSWDAAGNAIIDFFT